MSPLEEHLHTPILTTKLSLTAGDSCTWKTLDETQTSLPLQHIASSQKVIFHLLDAVKLSCVEQNAPKPWEFGSDLFLWYGFVACECRIKP